jgi:hypothetical protein
MNQTTRGLSILVASLTAESTPEFFSFAITLPEKNRAQIRIHPRLRKRIAPIQRKKPGPRAKLIHMAGITGKSGPSGNQNAFRHGLAAVHNRRAEGSLTEDERDIRAEILAGLIADSGGEAQISTATRILAEIISSDVAPVGHIQSSHRERHQEQSESQTKSQSPGPVGRL